MKSTSAPTSRRRRTLRCRMSSTRTMTPRAPLKPDPAALPHPVAHPPATVTMILPLLAAAVRAVFQPLRPLAAMLTGLGAALRMSLRTMFRLTILLLGVLQAVLRVAIRVEGEVVVAVVAEEEAVAAEGEGSHRTPAVLRAVRPMTRDSRRRIGV